MAEISLVLASGLPDAALAELARELKIALLENGFTEAAAGHAEGERGDPVTMGAIALAAFSGGGAVTALIKCLQAVLAKDRTLRVVLKAAGEIEIDAKNIGSADVRAAIEAAVAAVKR
jgi:hypothetical protein